MSKSFSHGYFLMENISKQKKSILFNFHCHWNVQLHDKYAEHKSNYYYTSINVKEINVLSEGEINILDWYSPRMPIPQLRCPGKH